MTAFRRLTSSILRLSFLENQPHEDSERNGAAIGNGRKNSLDLGHDLARISFHQALGAADGLHGEDVGQHRADYTADASVTRGAGNDANDQGADGIDEARRQGCSYWTSPPFHAKCMTHDRSPLYARDP